MVPLCLLACWLAWWGASYWLSPKPAWSITLPNNRQYFPIKECPDQRLLLCIDFQIGAKKSRAFPLGLTLLDPDTGNVKHSISVQDGEPFREIDQVNWFQFLGGSVAWMRIDRQSSGRSTYQLHRWHYRENRVTSSEQKWSGLYTHAYWPNGSNILVFQNMVPQSIYQIGYFDNPYFRLALKRLESLAHLPHFYWYESWELPTGSATEPRFLARWPAPYHGWGASFQLTEVGAYVIFPEPIGNDYQATQRAMASGKESFSGAELFDMYRSKSKELLIYNTRTGKVQHQYSDQAAYHSVSQSRQNYLVMNTYYPGPNSKATLAELNAATLNDNKYTRLFLQADELFRLDEQGITKLQRSPALIQAQLGDRLYFSGRPLQTYQQYSSHFISELAIVGKELEIKQVWPLPNTRSSYRSGHLLPLGNQAIVYGEGRQLPETLVRWFTNSPRVLKWIEKTWHTLIPQVQFTIVDSSDTNLREQAFTHQLCNNISEGSHLYCIENKNPEENFTATLHAYSLPMKLHSSWWSRVAGLLPLLLLLAYCLRKNHPRRLAGG